MPEFWSSNQLGKKRRWEAGSTEVPLFPCVCVSSSCWVAGCQATSRQQLTFVTFPQPESLTLALWAHILKVFQRLLDLGRPTHANNSYRRLRNNNTWCSMWWFSTWNILVRHSLPHQYLYILFQETKMRNQIILLRFFWGRWNKKEGSEWCDLNAQWHHANSLMHASF